jgi:hypothetical protein
MLSCKKGDTGSQGPAGPSFTGSIAGHVTLYDTYGDRVPYGTQNVTLTLKGGTTAQSDTNGFFIFNKVATGSYNVSASAVGYGSTFVQPVNFVSDTVYQNIGMSAVPDFDVTTLTAAYDSTTHNDDITFVVPSDTRSRKAIVFVNDRLPVNSTPSGYKLAYVVSLTPNMTEGWQAVPATDLNGVKIFYGQKVYYAAYSYVVNDASLYVDESTGKNVYTAVGTPVIDSVLAP